jgi:hypothetical protein
LYESNNSNSSSKRDKNSLELKENVDSGVYVKDLTSFVVKNVAGKRSDPLFGFIFKLCSSSCLFFLAFFLSLSLFSSMNSCNLLT